jgi:hypothetical protein
LIQLTEIDMKSTQLSNESDGYESQSSKNGQEDRKEYVRHGGTEDPEGIITGGEVGRVRTVETNTVSISKVDDKEGQAIEKQQNGRQQCGEEGSQEPAREGERES